MSNENQSMAAAPPLSKRAKILLVSGGAIVGVLLAYAFVFVLRMTVLKPTAPDGASFENLEDFRRAMLQRDERDVHADSSLSLRSLIQPNDSDLIIYTLQPNLRVKFQDVSVTTNSAGMRDEEMSPEKAPGVYRIALLGDSFAFGWGVEQEKIFAKIIENELNKATGGAPRVEVLNFGVPGYSTFQEVALFEEKGLQFSPDAVLVYFVENDFGLPFFIKNLAGDGEVVSNSEFQRMREQAEDDSPEESKHRALLKNLDANRALRRLAVLGRDKGLKTFVVVNPGRSWKHDERKLWVLKHWENLQLLRIAPQVKAVIAERGLKREDLRLATDPHPSALKHQIIGEVLAAELLPKLGLAQ